VPPLRPELPRNDEEGGVTFSNRNEAMMHDMMSSGMGPMMWGMGLLWILLIVVLVLAAAALVKYLISSRRGG
jgi:hypothetical protein